jgi:hypothetical protein
VSAASPTEPGIVAKILALHAALDAARLPHAFGGALALAWCTQRARGTIDIDLNVFVDTERSDEVFDALPVDVTRSDAELRVCRRDGQVRLWWGATPIDLFTDTTDFHRAVASRAVTHEFAGATVPFLGCSDLAVFKAFFSRGKDWVDLEEMLVAGTLDVDAVVGVLVQHLGIDDDRVSRLRALAEAPLGDATDR